MALPIVSGAQSEDHLTVDPTSKAVRITPYDFARSTKLADYDGIYSLSVADVAGYASAGSYFILWNPDSDCIGYLLSIEVESYSVAITATRISMVVSRVEYVIPTAANQIALSTAITKFNTNDPNPSCKVFPTLVTSALGPGVTAFGPNEAITAANADVVMRRIFEPPVPMAIRGFQGISIRSPGTDNISQTHSITFVWGEKRITYGD